MDKIRISKVDDVNIIRRGITLQGTLHLTPHHLIFSHIPASPTEDASGIPQKIRPKELWITYPMIASCTYRPAPTASHQQPSIRLRCRDFVFVAFHFLDERPARDAYETIRSLTCKLGRIEKLYAFSYRPQSPEKHVNGWDVYDPVKEWQRMGVTEEAPGAGWRISHINTDYQYSPTYPALLPVPATISDNVLNYAGKYRSRVRIPVLTYLHPINNCTITRSSQPLVGVRGNRSIQDEKLVAAIFASSKPRILSTQSSQTEFDSSPEPSQVEAGNASLENSMTDTEALEDEVLWRASAGSGSSEHRTYGAQQHNLIVDARPTVNAYAMQAVGLGSENMDHYPFAAKAYLGIDNIHVMRDSLNKVMDALKDSDLTPLPPNREQLARSGWLKHITSMLEGAALIARQIALQHSHVLIHCSDGWDRTSQLSSLSQLCLDPYYRTLEGFIVLVEKDWLSFGHMFRHRSGFLNSEKWFVIENERLGGVGSAGSGSGLNPSGGGNAFENALLSAKGFFNKDNASRDSLAESDGEMTPFDVSPSSRKRNATAKEGAQGDREVTKVKETSPVFHQFLDATYQLLYQYPTRFEFNERFLRRLLYHLYSCQYGTFLYNNEKDRVEAKVKERTRSVWDYFLARKAQFINENYDPLIDDREKGHERLLLPRVNEVRWWNEVFGRTDAEMNGPTFNSVRSSPGVLTGVETSETSLGAGVPDIGAPSMRSSNRVASLGSGLSGLTLSGKGRGPRGSRSPGPPRPEMEVEMQ
ncbi:protein phosphatase [Xylona heveae TC161]|uniref:Protein phosphatase n=1 Tax=Xylona heveae (strain CBS 132557 / TC161) TaxID=1328760 RepID=A0A165GHG8_XYLHT|nr:protein phosphatase [Xylona heveae TC161]KZF22189.1 protein phosphatase [Xylona heveae TC161]